jgi:ribosomal protein S18 acetylase RimI-like enzyme
MTKASLIDPALHATGLVRLPTGLVVGILAPDAVSGLAGSMALMEPWRGLGYTSAALARYWRRTDPGLVRLGVSADGELCGAMSVRARWLRGVFLELLCLLPAAQGAGHGAALLHWLSQEAAALAPNLWTSVADGNRRALDFYRREGFVEAARLGDLIQAGRDELLLRKRLADCERREERA